MMKIERYNKFPFIRLISSKIKYKTRIIGGDYLTDQQVELIKKNRDILIENGIQIRKVRFVFDYQFEYDPITNTVNPEYRILTPVDRFGNEIEHMSPKTINKPDGLIQLVIQMHQTEYGYHYEYIRQAIKYSENGVVFYINIENGREVSVENHDLRMIILDDVINKKSVTF